MTTLDMFTNFDALPDWQVALEIDEDYATRHGWGIVFGDLDIDTSTSAGNMQRSMFATVAKFERDRISERTREALAVKKAQGIRLGRQSVLSPEILSRMVAESADGASPREIADGSTRDGIPTAQGGQSWHASTVSKALMGQDGQNARATTVFNVNEGRNMYGVWQLCRHFSEPGLQPWAVSSDLLALEAWAVENIPPIGSLRLFFAEKTGLQTRFTDADWKVHGHLYKTGIKMLRKDPERYNRNRSGPSPAPTWVHGNYPDPTELDWQRKTVNIDSPGN